MMATDLPDFDSLWNYDDPTETEGKFREILLLVERRGDRVYQIELLTQLARSLGLQMKYDEAHGVLDEVEKLLPETGQRQRIRYLLERGRVFNSSGDPEKARPLFTEAWDIGRECGEDVLAVDAAHMVAITESGDKVLEWNEKAIAYTNQSNDPKAKRWNASLYNNIGWTYHDMGHYEIALDKFEHALICCQELGSPSRIRIAKWCIARTLRSLGRVEEALAIHEAQLKEYEAAGERPGYTYEELGECLLELGREGEARPYFRQAYAELSQDMWLSKNEAERLERLKRLAQ